jgi:mono/diheme cytochrome c family protein
MRILSRTFAMLLFLAPAFAQAQEVGDAQKGSAYAKQVCAECHAVQAGEEVSPNPDAPSFETVAGTPGMTARALAVWLQTAHPTMPNLMIPPDVQDNLIAYIMSLRAAQ